jgi:hypothetical protein
VSRCQAADYLTRAEPLAWALAPWMLPKSLGSRAQVALTALRRILAAPGLDGARRYLLFYCIQSGIKSNPKMAAEYEILLGKSENQEVREMSREMSPLTWANKMKAEGRQEVLQELVIRLFTEHFGEPSKRLRKHIAAITSAEELTRLVVRMSKGASLEELGLA